MKLAMVGFGLGITGALLVAGCGSEVDGSAVESGPVVGDEARGSEVVGSQAVDGEEPIRSLEQRAVSSNPLVDMSYVMQLQTLPPGEEYRDIAVSPNGFYLSTSCGNVHRYSRSKQYMELLGPNCHNLEYVEENTTQWRLICSSNLSRDIIAWADSDYYSLGSFPSGVNTLDGLTARDVGSNNQLDIYVLYTVNGSKFMRKGRYQSSTGALTWYSTVYPRSYYNFGLTGRPPEIYSVSIFSTSAFAWNDGANTTTYENLRFSPQCTTGCTEHAYSLSGILDRFGPRGLYYSHAENYFWGVDVFDNGPNERRWVIAGMSGNNLRR